MKPEISYRKKVEKKCKHLETIQHATKSQWNNEGMKENQKVPQKQ